MNGLHDLLAEKDRVQPGIAGENTLVDGQLLQRILDPLMHMLRNAVDHGVEPPHERQAAGKPAAGTIRLRIAAEGSHLNLCCQDDGRRLDLAAIHAKAVRAGRVEAEAGLSDERAMRLILLPGLSTREQATQMSGRGVGLDIVHRAVTDLRGTLEIHSEPGQGVRFDMVFPVQRSATQVMTCRSARQVLALPARGVDQLLPADENLALHPDGRMSYLLQDEALPALRLEVLLGLPPRAFAQPGAIEVVMIVRDHNRRRHALVVPELRDSRSVVVKPFNPIVPHRLGVEGAAILGDGSVAMMLDLPDLLRGQAAAGASAAAALQPGEPPVPRGLIVDALPAGAGGRG